LLSSGLETSAKIVVKSPVNSLETSSNASCLLPDKTTLAPSLRYNFAVANPIPLFAPVITATLFSHLLIVLVFI